MQAAGDLSGMFAAMKAAQAAEPYPDYQTRLKRLKALEAALERYEDRFLAALDADFGGRSPWESRFYDTIQAIGAARQARRNLRRWMRARHVTLAPNMWPATGRIVPQPKGVVGIIGPWNVPLNLTLSPLAAALAAGNRVILKPSEFVPETSTILAQMIGEIFAPDEVAVVTGGADVAQALTALPLDHLLFTGATEIGRKVALAAAQTLTPVTLELGGKSPAIVAEDADLAYTAQRLAHGRVANGGQLCVAPDYAILIGHDPRAFAEKVAAAWREMYPDGLATEALGAIINDAHLARVTALLKEAEARGTEIIAPFGTTPQNGKMPPVALVNPPEDARIMREEIFAPLLPILSLPDRTAAQAFVAARPHPLALYLFTQDADTREAWTRESLSGGMAVNDTILQVGAHVLPFGGIGASGMGAYHGDAGFETFSHMKPVVIQRRPSLSHRYVAPYGRLAQWVVRLYKRTI
ncbi:aldehyde dehydrogenase family protein [Paracoccaceae bacterium GXU_MW_L88]